MRRSETKTRWADRLAFRPSLGGRLEPRTLMAAGFSANIRAVVAGKGKTARILDTDGELYDVDVSGPGTVKASPLPGGRVKLVVAGTTTYSDLTINPDVRLRQTNDAHEFPAGVARNDGVLHVGEIDVTSGAIQAILGYQTAELSGPVNIKGTSDVDRIAFDSIDAGSSINVGTPPSSSTSAVNNGQGSLNTLDVYTNLTLGGGPSIVVGQDLNELSVKGNLTLTGGGSSILVGRDLGLNVQGAKGSDSGGQGAQIDGNLIIDPGSTFAVGRNIVGPVIVYGDLVGASLIEAQNVNSALFVVYGTTTP